MSITSYANVYMQTDNNGNVIYSDTPIKKNAQKIDVPAINTTSSTPPQPTESNIPSSTNSQPTVMTMQIVKKPYTTFVIRSPADQETIQNQPKIAVDISIDPDLQSGDVIQVYLDGNTWGKPLPSTHVEFTAPDRGIHQISAKLMDKNGKVLKETPSNTVYIHQANLGASPPRLGPGM